MQYIKPIRVELNKKRYRGYTQDVKHKDAHPAERNKPGFGFPVAYRHQHDAQPYKRLFEWCAGPYYARPAARCKPQGRRVGLVDRIAEQRHYPIHALRRHFRQPRKRRSYIQSEPRHRHIRFVTRHRVFPQRVTHQQRHHKDDHIPVRLQFRSYFFPTFQTSSNYIIVFANGTASIGHNSPSRYLRYPASAIIAALSVVNANGGIYTSQ